jgi:hypothetical protein
MSMDDIKARYVHGASDADGRQWNANAVEAAVWEALEPHTEQNIALDLNDPAESTAFAQMVADVTFAVLAVVERRAPVQARYGPTPIRRGSIAWSEHLKAYKAYSAAHGNSQSAERIAERGGFGYNEIVTLLGAEPKTWRAE